jgi:hypothetical protein
MCHVSGALAYKLDILKKMNLDSVTAVIPLLQFSIIKLKDLAALAEKDSLEVPYGSRMKYTCEKLQVHLLYLHRCQCKIYLICLCFFCYADFCSSAAWETFVSSLQSMSFCSTSHLTALLL